MTNTTTPTRATAFAGVVVFGVQKNNLNVPAL
jgi:hypothetical protein